MKKVAQFFLDKFPGLAEFVKEKIQELENEMVGKKGTAKMEALNVLAVGFINKEIDIVFSNPIERAFVNPLLKSLVAAFIPAITQKVYDIFKATLVKAEKGLS